MAESGPSTLEFRTEEADPDNLGTPRTASDIYYRNLANEQKG